MEKEKNIDLDEEEKGGVQGEEADDDTEKDDEFEYDDDGNIIIPDVIEDEDQDEDGDDDAADTDDDTDDEDEGEGGSDDEDKETPKPETQPEGKDEKDAQIEALKKELDALKAQSEDTLAKLGVKSENVLEGLEKVAAESDDMSLDEYRKKKAESQRDDAARKLLQQAEFEKKMLSDFAEIQREFPETRGLKSLREIENLAKFGRFRDLGLSPKEAYAAANPDSVRKSVAAATKQQSLNETKAHLKSAVPAGSKDDGIAISKKELREWRDLFPNLSDKEISRLYRESAKKEKGDFSMFKLIKIENARMNVPEPVFHEVTASEAVVMGEALVLTSGKLTKCGATAKPEFIAMADCAADATNRLIPAARVEPNQLYEVPVQAAPTSLVEGSKVTLHTDGLQVTATTTSGVVTVESLNGAAAAGDVIVVRIV